MDDQVKSAKRIRWFKYAVLIFIILVVVLAVWLVPRGIPFWLFTTQDVVVLMVALLLISLFIERSVEVIIKAWRGSRKEELALLFNSAKKKLKEASEQNEKTKASADYHDQALAVTRYSSETRNLAFLTAFAFGIAISALGIRVLQPLVDPAVFKSLSRSQLALFTGMDTLLTGALLGGGSNGIHKILDMFLTFVDQTRSRLKESPGTAGEK